MNLKSRGGTTENQSQDMGSGSIGKLLAQLAVPAVVAQIINLLYNIVDRIYIGHIPEIGASALTGVGLFMPILMLINAFAMLCGSGGAPRAAIAMGQKDNETAEKIVGNCFALLIAIAVVLTAVFYVGAPGLLRLFGASDVTLPYAVSYARIYILGSVFVLIVMGMNPFITTQGFAKISMMTTVIGAVINIILDPIFIFVFGMGVQGAALATVLSQAVGAVWILRFLTGSQTTLHLRKRNLKLIPGIIGPCLALGVSTFVMLSTESLLSISFTSSLSRYGGDLAVGAMTIINSVSQLVSITFTILFWAALMLAPQIFAGIFTGDAELVSYATWAMRIYMAGIFSNGFQMCCQQSFMALGQAKISLLLACLRKLILLIPLIFILPMLLQDKVFAVFLAEPVSDILAATVTTTVFMTRFNKILRQGAARVAE